MTIKLINAVSKTVLSKTGTTIEKTARKLGDDCIKTSVSRYGAPFTKARLITFGEGTPLKNLGITQALIHEGNAGGKRINVAEFYNGDKLLHASLPGKKDETITFFKILKDFAENRLKIS